MERQLIKCNISVLWPRSLARLRKQAGLMLWQTIVEICPTCGWKWEKFYHVTYSHVQIPHTVALKKKKDLEAILGNMGMNEESFVSVTLA